MRRPARALAAAALAAAVAPALVASGCVTRSADLEASSSFDVVVRSIDGADLPTRAAPHPVDLARATEVIELDVTARKGDGSVDASYTGFARISIRPGTVVSIESPGAIGRNVLLTNGVARGQKVRVTGAHGPARIWVEDLGYVPASPDAPPACADGKDDDGDGLVDYPGDPGCAFANDDTEEGGSYATGISPPIWYALPRLADVQGLGAATPYAHEQLDILADAPASVVVTRIASDGFYVSDVAETRGYGHLYAFNFSAPAGLRVCDRLTSLSGTPSEFFGYTELGFPSWTVQWWDSSKGPCPVPEPVVLAPNGFQDAPLEKLESGLVRVQDQVLVAAKFGPGIATNPACLANPPSKSTSGSTIPAATCTFEPAATNCDLDGDGKIDFATPGSVEANCATNCNAWIDCSEWSGYAAQHNFRVRVGTDDTVQVNADAVSGFDPPSMRGLPLASVTGTLRNFSGGNLNWTIEARCTEDLVFCPLDPVTHQQDPACVAHPPAPLSSQKACVRDRTLGDPGSN